MEYLTPIGTAIAGFLAAIVIFYQKIIATNTAKNQADYNLQKQQHDDLTKRYEDLLTHTTNHYQTLLANTKADFEKELTTLKSDLATLKVQHLDCERTSNALRIEIEALKLRIITRQDQICTVTVNEDGIILDACDAIPGMFEYRSIELAGKPLSTILPGIIPKGKPNLTAMVTTGVTKSKHEIPLTIVMNHHDESLTTLEISERVWGYAS